MIEQIPLSTILNNAMVSCPAYYRLKYYALVCEGAVGVVADGIAEEVAVAGGVGEVVLAVVLVHPRCLEEAVRIAGLQRLSVAA